MEYVGKNFPRIHSLTTVGIRNHTNLDLLIHEIRTDFNGESGSGKSIVGADIPQLILTGGRWYKSATEPKSNAPREYNTLVLKDIGYCFMNIEIERGKFITIGVYIRKSPKQLYPFIIQGNMGIHFEKNPVFNPLNRALRYRDFILNNQIPILDNLRDHLDNKGIYLTQYFHKVDQYHKLLKINEILHLDLSADENLQRNYAHTLQSLARGEDIATSGIKFKKFLFHYDDDVANKFKLQAQQIEEDHAKYVRDWETQNTLSKKKEVLLNLLSLKRKVNEAIDRRIKTDVFYHYQQKKRKEKELKETRERFFLIELDVLSVSERKVEVEISKLEKEVAQRRNELKNYQNAYDDAVLQLETIQYDLDEINTTLPKIVTDKDLYQAQYQKVQQVGNWLGSYGSIENLTTAYHQQVSIARQEEKLNDLLEFLHKRSLYSSFASSEYSKSVRNGIQFYSKRKDEINRDIEYITKISKIISSQNKDSFGGWAVASLAQLNQVQESLLFHFATLATSKSTSDNYIPNPKVFLEGLTKVDETDHSFVLDLGGLYYHVPKRPDYIFSNPKQLKKKIDEIGAEFEQRIASLKQELAEIQKLDVLFTASLNYSEEHLASFQNEGVIKSFKRDLSLSLTENQFQEHVELYEKDSHLSQNKKIKNVFEGVLRVYEEKLGKKTVADEMIRSNSGIKTRSKIKIDELTAEVDQRDARINFLGNTERVGHESKLILWKSDQQNNLVDKDTLIHQARMKFNKLNIESDLHEKQIELVKESSPLKAQIPTLDRELEVLTDLFEKRKRDYQNHFNTTFNENELVPTISDQDLSEAKSLESTSLISYREKYDETFAVFENYLKESPKLKQHNYDLNALILELIPPEIISNKENPAESLLVDIESKLSELHQKIKELSKEEATKIISTVKDIRNIVKRQILFLEQIQALLADFTLATHRRVQLKWSYSTDFDLQWISALESDVNNLNFEDNLFGERSKVSAHELLEKTFKKYCPSKMDAKAYDILDPFNYYDAEATIVDHTGTGSPGSGGQNYGMLALLCVAKLSIVEGKTKNIFTNIEKGVRVLPIDEVAGLGQNYETLSEIAQELDYQIFTMTVSANDLDFEEGKQIYYEFIPNARKELSDYNEGVQACFSKNNLVHDLEAYYSEELDSYKLKQ